MTQTSTIPSATTPSSTVRSYQEVAANLPDEVFLGQLMFFTISEGDVSLERMRQELDNRNLRKDDLPKRLRRIDAFKKAVAEAAVKFPRTAHAQHSVLVRSVGQDSQTSHRHIVLERALFAPGKRRQLVYDALAMAVYDRGVRQKDGTIRDDSITVTVNDFLGGYTPTTEEQTWIDAHIGADGEKVIERHKHWCEHMDANAVRTFVRHYIQRLGGVQMKARGGVYFVAQKHSEELRDLAEFVNSIGSHMHLIPLLDIVEQREMLGRAFEQETMDEVDSVMAEIAKILGQGNRTITQATYDEYVNRAAQLMVKADDYTQLLDNNLDTARIRINTLTSQVLNLGGRIKTPKKMRKS